MSALGCFQQGVGDVDGVMVGGQTAWRTQRLENIDPTRPFLCNPKLEWVCAQYRRGTMTMTHCRISFLFTCQVFPVIYLL